MDPSTSECSHDCGAGLDLKEEEDDDDDIVVDVDVVDVDHRDPVFQIRSSRYCDWKKEKKEDHMLSSMWRVTKTTAAIQSVKHDSSWQ